MVCASLEPTITGAVTAHVCSCVCRGSFESSAIFYTEIQFDQSVADSTAATIVADPLSSLCAFKQTPENGKLLMPPENTPYSGGYYEQQMSSGQVDFQFKTNISVTTSNLCEPFHARKFRFAVWCLNPYLNRLASFRATSMSFIIKSTLHNDLKRSERYVLSSGHVIQCPIDQIPSVAAPNRRKRKIG